MCPASVGTLETTVRTGETTPGDSRTVIHRSPTVWLLLLPQEQGLDLDQLLGPGPYKEQYRADMIRWGEVRRRQDPGFFCRLATKEARRPVWVRHHSVFLFSFVASPEEKALKSKDVWVWNGVSCFLVLTIIFCALYGIIGLNIDNISSEHVLKLYYCKHKNAD